jgi:hypothetical protein
LQLKVELSQLKIELNQLRCLLYNSWERKKWQFISH